jgi:hypothetical protein
MLGVALSSSFSCCSHQMAQLPLIMIGRLHFIRNNPGLGNVRLQFPFAS